ncbi:MAG: class I SAM-dependent methyltransferase [Ferruginibacter sp.]
MALQNCKVCGNNSNNTLHQVKEMQLGLRETFIYMKCGNCGCMQLLDIPSDLGKYYPNEDYYSFNLGLDIKQKPDALRKIKSSYLLYGKHKLLGSILSLGYKEPDYLSWIKIPAVKYDDAILDVGTGNGSLLLNLFKIGFTNLTGIDPFIDKEQHYGKVNILKQDIFEVKGQYDYIMLHHAFEHMDEPLKVLLQLKKLLRPGRFILIRIPLMDMYGWKTYGTDWVGMDAPRHIIIHTIKSMQLLAAAAGLEMKKIVFDSGPYHLWASEQYKHDLALMEPNSYMVNKQTAVFTKEQMETFAKIAEQTNKEGQGDQAAFYLYKP